MGRHDEIDEKLRGVRAEPPEELVRQIVARSGGQGRSGIGSRLAFAAAVTVMMLGTFASFGGLGYAASGGSHVISTIAKVTESKRVVVHSATSDQYPPPANTSGSKNTSPPSPPTGNNLAAAGQPAGTLPFTGFSLLATLVLSLALIGAGLLLRRNERRKSTT